MAEEKKGQEQEGEARPGSRIVVEFAGPGMADVASAHFENVSVGQMLAFAQWAQWQADRAVMKMEAERARQAQLNKIVVPRGVMQ